MTKQMNDKSNFIYVQYYCVCSKNITDWPPSVQHRTYEPYEVSFNITVEYYKNIRTAGEYCCHGNGGSLDAT
jgi:hypothetical protein